MANENEQLEELKISELGDGSVVVGEEPSPAPVVAEDDGEDERPAAAEHPDDEGAVEGETVDEAEARRQRNRARRQQAKQNRKAGVDSLRRELSARDAMINELTQRLAVVERRSTGSEMVQLDQAEREAIQAYNHFKAVNEQAIATADGATSTAAVEKMYAARQRLDQINTIKKQLSQRQQQPQPLDPRLQRHAEDWMGRNGWYDPAGSDEDSAVVMALDNRLANEGWNPTTPEYWEELDARVKKYLPHRANSGYNRAKEAGNNGAPSRSPVAGSGRESSGAASNTGGAYKLSAERVRALKDAGIWDDPKQRAEAIKRFQEYDKQNQI